MSKELFDYKDHVNLCKDQEVGSYFKLQRIKEVEFEKTQFL